MKKNNRWLTVAVSFLGVFLLVGCQEKKQKEETIKTEQTDSSQVSTDEKQEIKVSITIDDGEKKEESTIKVNEENNLLAVMKEKFDAKDEKGFLTSISGIEQNKTENKFWVFTINGEQVNVGAEKVQLKPNDKVEWKLEKF